MQKKLVLITLFLISLCQPARALIVVNKSNPTQPSAVEVKVEPLQCNQTNNNIQNNGNSVQSPQLEAPEGDSQEIEQDLLKAEEDYYKEYKRKFTMCFAEIQQDGMNDRIKNFSLSWDCFVLSTTSLRNSLLYFFTFYK
jgi:hypothetical protein